jgi:hypothetical protein
MFECTSSRCDLRANDLSERRLDGGSPRRRDPLAKAPGVGGPRDVSPGPSVSTLCRCNGRVRGGASASVQSARSDVFGEWPELDRAVQSRLGVAPLQRHDGAASWNRD